MEDKYFIEVSFNVWNCNATLYVEVWQNIKHARNLIESVKIPCTQAEINKNIDGINMSGVYPVKKLNKTTDILVKKTITGLMEKYLNN